MNIETNNSIPMDVCGAVEASAVKRPKASEAGRILTEKFSSGDRVLDSQNVVWKREEESDAIAGELIDLHACSLEMERAYDIEGAELPVGKKISRNDRTVTHLGQGVFVQDNTIGIDPDSQRQPKTITTEEIRYFSRLCLDSSINDRPLVIGTGHPGIGKTRGALAYTLQELLWRGEAVMRVGHKNNRAFLFLPDESATYGYRVWACKAYEWRRSNLCGKFAKSSSLFVLIDPPEMKFYNRAANCHVIVYATNDEKWHIQNAWKDGTVFVMKMPRLDEILCMEEVLYNERKFPIRDEHFESKEERLEELRKRCSLVGCVPRIVFNGQEFIQALDTIKEDAARKFTESNYVGNLLHLHRGGLYGIDKNIISPMSRFLFVEPSGNSHERAKAFLNPATTYYVRNALQEQVAGLDGNQAFLFEDISAMLLKGGTWNGKTLPTRQIQYGANLAHTTELILGLSNGQTLVRASNCYPVLDFATSPTTWFNAKVGEIDGKVSLSDFVTLMCELGFAVIDDQNRLLPFNDVNISLTMIRNSSVDKCCFDYKLVKKYEKMDWKQIQEVFKRTVKVDFLNTADWSTSQAGGRTGLNGALDARMELIQELLTSYHNHLSTSTPKLPDVQNLKTEIAELKSQVENYQEQDASQTNSILGLKAQLAELRSHYQKQDESKTHLINELRNEIISLKQAQKEEITREASTGPAKKRKIKKK